MKDFAASVAAGLIAIPSSEWIGWWWLSIQFGIAILAMLFLDALKP